jgi:hypothetical protein
MFIKLFSIKMEVFRLIMYKQLHQVPKYQQQSYDLLIKVFPVQYN